MTLITSPSAVNTLGLIRVRASQPTMASSKTPQPPAQLPQPCLNKLLPLFGHVILSVFAEISQGDGLLELLGKLMAQLVFENVDLILQFLFDVLRHAKKIINPGFGRNRPTTPGTTGAQRLQRHPLIMKCLRL